MNQLTQNQLKCVIAPEKDIVASNLETLRKQLQELLDSGCRELVLDLKHVRIVDSRGLALFMLCQNSLSRVGGHLRIVTQDEDLLHLFRIMRMDQHMTVSEQV